MKLTKCKRCDAPDVYWTQNSNGKWHLVTQDGKQHFCDDGKIKAVKCKYCSANDLHWAEEINPHSQEKKMVLTESYGLQHACDERLAFIAKEKQDKKDKYEAEKKRVAAHPDGQCPQCKGSGYGAPGIGGVCANCAGHASFSERTRKGMLAAMRAKIWPNMQSYKFGQRGW